MRQKLFLISALIILASCATVPQLPIELKLNEGHAELETVAIMAFNDFHGALAPQTAKTRENDGTTPQEYQVGGAATLAAHVKILRKEFGRNLLVLDAGDQLQGSIESNLTNGAPVISFYNQIGLNAAALGNHEFDFGVETLKTRISEAKYPYLSANVLDRTTGNQPTWPNLFPRTIIQTSRIKVGIIGLTTETTPSIVRQEYISTVNFTDIKAAAIREAAALRREGANIVIILGHLGLNCQPGKAPTTHAFRKPTDPTGTCDTDEATVLAKELPPGTVDAIISGHSHTMVFQWINGIPVIQAGTRTNYHNVIYFTYDWQKNQLITDRTRIEGPVPVCPLVFENQRDCNGNKTPPRQGRGPLVTPTFHGKEIHQDASVESLLAPIFTKTETEKKRIIGEAVLPVTYDRTTESPMGNLVADAIRATAGTDVALMNRGGIRAPFEAGSITYEALFRSLPFDNYVSRLKVTGKELKLILRVAQSGARGLFPVSGLELKIYDFSNDSVPSSDLNGDKKIQPWEVNRLIEARLADGSTIQDNKTYTLATIDYLVTGGDDMQWVMSQIPKERIELNAGGLIRDSVQTYIETRGKINTSEAPLLITSKPRFIIKKSSGKGKKRGSKKRHYSQAKEIWRHEYLGIKANLVPGTVLLESLNIT